jgi:uncharacterized protein YecE (DUF72 family)
VSLEIPTLPIPDGELERPGIVRIGISGWSYRHWRGDFYPAGLPTRVELNYALERFASVEVNRTFYSLVTPSAYMRWYDSAPPGFEYAIKGSRFITHNKKLHNVEDALANFFASGLLALREKLGPLLWQIGPNLTFDPVRLERFLQLLPTHMKTAAEIARRQTLPGRETVTTTDLDLSLRHVLEVRHPSWFNDETAEIARRFGVALAFSHSSRWPYVEEITAPFVYVRLHGPRQLYSSPYSKAQLGAFARRIDLWSRGREPEDAVRIGGTTPASGRRDVYVYFDNDTGGYAPRQALELARLLARRRWE